MRARPQYQPLESARRASFLAVLASVLSSAPAVAQVCRGFGSFERGPIRLSGSGTFNSHASTYVAGAAVGLGGAFGELGVGVSDVNALNGSSLLYAAGAGYQVHLNHDATAQLCPTVGVGFAYGPDNVNDTGLDYRETDFSLGVDAGVVATATTHVAVVPTGSMSFASAHPKFTSRGGANISSTQSFGVLGLGVGFVFGQEVSITPTVLRPFGLSGAATSFMVTVAFHVGRARTAVVSNRATSCAGLASTDSAVYDTTEVAERARLRIAPEPAYPPLERESGIAGQVLMSAIIGPDGTAEPGSPRVLQGIDAAIDRAALRWIREASYWPACRDARPVRARIVERVEFCAFPPCRHGKP